MEFLRPFFEELVNATTSHSPTEAIGLISTKLYPLLLNEQVKDNIPLWDNIAWERMDGVTLLTHAHAEVTASPPHDHGEAWVFYGVLDGVTTMVDFFEIPETTCSVPDQGKLAVKASYTLVPGQWGFYDVYDIHSHRTSDHSRWIRIESRNIHRGDMYGKMWENPDDIIH